MNFTPIPNEQFKIEEIDGETLLYHLGQTKTVYLNQSATIIWQLCDGERTVDEIVSLLQENYPEDAQTIAGDVETALTQFVNEGAIELVEVSSENTRDHTPGNT